MHDLGTGHDMNAKYGIKSVCACYGISIQPLLILLMHPEWELCGSPCICEHRKQALPSVTSCSFVPKIREGFLPAVPVQTLGQPFRLRNQGISRFRWSTKRQATHPSWSNLSLLTRMLSKGWSFAAGDAGVTVSIVPNCKYWRPSVVFVQT